MKKPKTNTFEIQTGSLGRDFKLSATHKGEGSKWVGNELRHDWYHIFKYLDDNSVFALHEDFNGKIIEKLNHKETNSKLLKL